MFDDGFFGTRASFYMDFSTLYFAILPFLLAYAIKFAKNGEIEKHLKSNLVIYVITMVVVVIFEVGVRVSGGFVEFMQYSSMPEWFLITFLAVHILIALLSVVLWTIVLYSSLSNYKFHGKDAPYFKRHKRLGKIAFLGMTLTSFMGVLIYIFIFIY